MDEALKIAKNCRHYAMCKIDFLGSGVCASGLEKHYVSFYPEGRMDLYAALVENVVPVTEKCVEIAESCNLCGKCDYQCYFVNELRPSKVMKALKDYVASYLGRGGKVFPTEEDPILAQIKGIVGEYWVTSDPAIKIAYHHDLCPHATFKMPRYVVMPSSVGEISSLIELFNRKSIEYIVRGNGASSHGLVFSEGAVIDMNRMKTIEFDERNWSVKAGPGIASFDLQREAKKRGYRVNTAEPSALVCANIMTTGIVSTFSTAYGICADNFIDAEFVAKDCSRFTLNDPDAPNLFSFRNSNSEAESVALCVSVTMKLHPVTDDESGILVPFESLEDALHFAKDCAVRRIGLALAVLGGHYVSTFLAPTKKLAAEVQDVFTNKLAMPYLVLLIGDRYALRSVREMGYPAIDQELFRTLFLGMPALESAGWMELLKEISDDEPFSYLKLDQFAELAETALAPSSARLVQDIDADLKPFFEKLYAKAHITDLVWLNTFRILSSRVTREQMNVSLPFYLPIEDSLILEVIDKLRTIAERHRIKGDFGFITPIDCGKRCAFEYDYYFDHNDPGQVLNIQEAAHEAGAALDEYSARPGTLRQLRYYANRGCCRKENLLYT